MQIKDKIHVKAYINSDILILTDGIQIYIVKSYQITPHATPLQGQGQTSANFSASLELTLRDIVSSYMSKMPIVYYHLLNEGQWHIFAFVIYKKVIIKQFEQKIS